MSTGDEERLTPLGVAVNGQDRSEISPASHHHLAGHHVIARTGSARRHRQGPQAARMRGRREATSLARCRAQIEHRSRDGRRIHRGRARCHVRARRSGQRSRPAHTPHPVRQSGAERVPFGDPEFPARTEPDCPDKVRPRSAPHLTARSIAGQARTTPSPTATLSPAAMA